jgi:hypothetical protein
MKRLSKDEDTLLKKVCTKHNVDSNHLRTLLIIEREYSYKSSSRNTTCRNELLKNIEIWTR